MDTPEHMSKDDGTIAAHVFSFIFPLYWLCWQELSEALEMGGVFVLWRRGMGIWHLYSGAGFP